MPRIEAPTVAEHNVMRRRQVIAAAAEVLSDGGVATFTPAAVAKRAGLARSSMYQYYPSTDALLGAAITELLQRSRDRMVAAVAAADSPAERITAYVRTALSDATTGHGATPDVSGMSMPEVCREGVRRLHDELLEPLRTALSDAAVQDPGTVAVLVRGLINAAASDVGHGTGSAAMADATIDFVLRGVGLPHGPRVTDAV
ncbi:MAG: TetR/AcrR family transcriptional regulator [Candidatus Phosphoribacter sp.]